MLPELQTEVKHVDDEKEKLNRVEASLRERERQVHAQQAEMMNEREKEKEKHVKEKETQHFLALMSDMVRVEMEVFVHDTSRVFVALDVIKNMCVHGIARVFVVLDVIKNMCDIRVC